MTSSEKSKGQHKLELAEELLEDIELSRLPAGQLALKAARLARLAGNAQAQVWLTYETKGYNNTEQHSLEMMGFTGRWTDPEKQLGHYGPLSQIHDQVTGLQAELEAYKLTELGGDKAAIVLHHITRRRDALSKQLTRLQSIRNRVLGLLHQFTEAVYYELLFGQAAEGIFEKYRSQIDLALSGSDLEALRKFPKAYERLADGDSEAISQAMLTCRRIIEGFADSVAPPESDPASIDGQELDMGSDKYKNRLNVFVARRTTSSSRRQRLRQTLSNLHGRVCTGVHDDVTPEEARALILSTYVYLGEFSELPEAVPLDVAEKIEAQGE